MILNLISKSCFTRYGCIRIFTLLPVTKESCIKGGARGWFRKGSNLWQEGDRVTSASFPLSVIFVQLSAVVSCPTDGHIWEISRTKEFPFPLRIYSGFTSWYEIKGNGGRRITFSQLWVKFGKVSEKKAPAFSLFLFYKY